METTRPLRADAARNHRRIVEAAASAFEEVGADVSLEEIAQRAGLGVATLYRRFHTREQLVRDVVEHLVTTELEPAVAPSTDDPWADLVGTLVRTVETLAAHRVIVEVAKATSALDMRTAERYGRRLEGVLARARDAGVVRPELAVHDLGMAITGSLSLNSRLDSCGRNRRRYLALMIDGMRPGHPELPALAPHPGADGVSEPPAPPSAPPGR